MASLTSKAREQWLKVPGLSLLVIRYSSIRPPRHAESASGHGDPTDPRYIIERRRADAYAARSDRLNWLINISASTAPKKVVRSWMKRRFRNAIEQALRARNLDWEGQPLEGRLGSLATADSPRGYFILFLQKKSVTATWELVKREADILVTAVIRQGQNPEPQRRPSRPQTNRPSLKWKTSP